MSLCLPFHILIHLKVSLNSGTEQKKEIDIYSLLYPRIVSTPEIPDEIENGSSKGKDIMKFFGCVSPINESFYLTDGDNKQFY